MTRQVNARTSAWLALLLALLIGAGCSHAPPEEALRDTVAELQATIDARDAGGSEGYLAEDFIGPEGMDRRGARRLAAATFLRFRDVSARLGPLKVSLQDEQHATVEFSAAVTASGGGLLPEDGQVYRVRTGWRREGADWRLVNADWTPAL
jgi:hypothetical protein